MSLKRFSSESVTIVTTRLRLKLSAEPGGRPIRLLLRGVACLLNDQLLIDDLALLAKSTEGGYGLGTKFNIKKPQNGDSARSGPAMPQDIPATYVLSRTFADVDDLAVEAQQWSVDFRQLERGKFRGNVLQFGAHGVHISHARFGRSLNQKGTPPVGMRTVAVPASADLRLKWRGKSIDGQSLMVFPLGSELSSVSGRDFHVYTCSFPEELLSSVGEVLEIGGIDEVSGGVEAIRIESSAITKLQSCLRQICTSVRNDPTALANTSLVSNLTVSLPKHLMNALASGKGKCPPTTGHKRLVSLARAEAFIAMHACDNIKIADICRAADVSERTLQYAFIERFGIGPKEYLRAYRLNAVRRQLRNADPRTTGVADVANLWGFWHMGQFAADYRQRFEELPSDTLQRRSV